MCFRLSFISSENSGNPTPEEEGCDSLGSRWPASCLKFGHVRGDVDSDDLPVLEGKCLSEPGAPVLDRRSLLAFKAGAAELAGKR
mmetsp:Transcript_64101/g.153099  ORF Transcript_64101/g.153099 Transcript_64101/m.153099 type:complete len:85 (-) Transcript_64101:6-260(-)